MSTNKTYIDADSILYIIGSGFKETYQWNQVIQCKARVNEFVESILIATAAQEYVGFVGEGRNFRYDIAITKPYKGTRKEKEPWFKHWEPIIREHLKTKWLFTPVVKIEADDAVIIMHYAHGGGVIASPDKDLKQIAGKIYDYRTREMTYLTAAEGARNLYRQLLMGDSTDNIPGCPGIGKTAKVMNKLQDSDTPFGIFAAAVRIFINRMMIEIPAKEKAKAETEYLVQFKVDNDLKRFNKKTKLVAIKEFEDSDYIDTTPNLKDVKIFIREQLALVRMLRKPGHGFVIPDLVPVPAKVKAKERIVKDTLPNKLSKLDQLLDL